MTQEVISIILEIEKRFTPDASKSVLDNYNDRLAFVENEFNTYWDDKESINPELITKLYNYFDGKGGYNRTKEQQELYLALKKEVEKFIPKEVETYYQPELYSDDGTNIDYGFPEELASFHVFRTKEECEDWLEDNGYDLKDCIIHEYHDDDIEEHVYID